MPVGIAGMPERRHFDDTLAEAHASLANALTIDLQRRAAEPRFSEGIDKRLDPHAMNRVSRHCWRNSRTIPLKRGGSKEHILLLISAFVFPHFSFCEP